MGRSQLHPGCSVIIQIAGFFRQDFSFIFPSFHKGRSNFPGFFNGINPHEVIYKIEGFKLFRRTYIILGDIIPFETLGYDAEASGEYARITSIAFDRICDIGEQFESELAAKKAKKKKK